MATEDGNATPLHMLGMGPGGQAAPQHGAPQHGAPQHGAPQHGVPQMVPGHGGAGDASRNGAPGNPPKYEDLMEQVRIPKPPPGTIVPQLPPTAHPGAARGMMLTGSGAGGGLPPIRPPQAPPQPAGPAADGFPGHASPFGGYPADAGGAYPHAPHGFHPPPDGGRRYRAPPRVDEDFESFDDDDFPARAMISGRRRRRDRDSGWPSSWWSRALAAAKPYLHAAIAAAVVFALLFVGPRLPLPAWVSASSTGRLSLTATILVATFVGMVTTYAQAKMLP